ncbi:MAG: TonB-dependent receptor plug domain-containing protein [Bacteroidales bacterium]|nr:TonB-dependent receptor plug domain-containing protein [Bacteroidales bacterium]
MKKILLLSTILLAFFNAKPQAFNKFLNEYHDFSSNYYFEKIFVHSNKDNYNGNDSIFLKIYVWDSKNNKPSKIEQIIFVELINNNNKIITHRKFLSKNGVVSGVINFSDTLFEGNYQLRAYTNSMKNFESEYFFTKNIYLKTNNIKFSNTYFRAAKKLKKKNKTPLLNFCIYDDVLIPNSSNQIEILITDNQYNKINTKTNILSKKKSIIHSNSNISHNILFLNTLTNNKYFIFINEKPFKSKKTYLPIASTQNLPIIKKADNSSDFVINFTGKKTSNDSIANTYLVLIEREGTIYYSNFIRNYSDTLTIKNDSLPEGWLNFLFVNKQGVVEFLRIRNNYLPIKKEIFKVDKIIANDTLFIQITKHDNLDTAYISVSTDINESIYDIKSYFNYFSNLPYNLFLNYNNSSADYNNLDSNFQFSYKQKFYKYDYNNLSNLSNKKELYQPQKTVSISGFISNILEKLPAKNADVKITVLNAYNDVYYTKTNDEGRFIFEDLQYSDTIEYLIESKTQTGKNHTVIQIDQYDTMKINFFPYLNIDLDKLSYSKIIKKNQHNNKSSHGTLYSNADQIIYSDDFINSGQNSVLNILDGRVPGFRKVGNSSIMRGFSSINLSSEPLYLLDNVPVNVGTIEALNIDDIDRIEIVKNSSQTAIYGSRGSNGIISVYTKKGYNIEWGKISGYILGISSNQKTNGFFWQPNIVITDSIFTIKVPLKTSEYTFISIQGFSSKGELLNFKFSNK